MTMEAGLEKMDAADTAGLAIYQVYSRRDDAAEQWHAMAPAAREQFRAEGRAAIEALVSAGFIPNQNGVLLNG
jgi:hypothetical protein